MVSAKKEGEELEGLLTKQRELYDKLYDMELQKDAIFSTSADSMAKNNLIEWWILNLTHYRKGDSAEYKLFFGDGDFEEKYELLCQMEDNEHELFNLAIPTAANIVTLWSTSGVENFDEYKEVIEGAEAE